MYAEHFGLNDRPFARQPGEHFYIPNDTVARMLDHMQQVLLGRDSIAVVTGGPGVGKTSLIARAAADASDQALVVEVDLRQAETDLLYDMLSLSLGGESARGDLALGLHSVRESVGRHNRDGKTVTAIIDMNGMNAERAKRIIRLVHMTGQVGSQLNLVIQGPHTLQKIIDVRGLIHLRQRVTCRYQVRPLTVDETDAYIRHYLSSAGGDADAVLDSQVPQVVHRFVAGVPRLINTMMDTALSEASVQRQDQLTSDLVAAVAQRLGWRTMDRRAAPAAAAPAQRPASAAPGNTDKPGAVQKTGGQLPASDATTRLLAGSPETARPQAASPAGSESGAAPAAKPGVPEMDPKDTGATGMLKLEDLDAKFAETVFGEDTGMFATLDAADTEKEKEDEPAKQ